MTEQELLRAIQNTDAAYFAEAEERIQNKEAYTMKKSVIRWIAAGTAAAAVLALTVTAGIYFGRKDGLTAPAADAPAQVTEQRKENFLGGIGTLRMGVNQKVLYDDENWYLMNDAAKISDEKYITVHFAGRFERIKQVKGGGDLLADCFGKDELFVFDREANCIDAVSDTGVRSRLFDLNPHFPAEEYTAIRMVHHIAHLNGSRYFIDGYYCADTKSNYFRCIFDAESTSGSMLIFNPDEKPATAQRMEPDGSGGVYLDEFSDNGKYIIRHCTKDNMHGTAYDIVVKPQQWFMKNGFIYYLDAASGEYCKYNMNNGEKKTIGGEYEGLMFSDGKVCAVFGNCLYIMDPDKETEPTEVTLPYENLNITDICGDTVCISSLGNMQFRGYVLYNLKTGNIQYVYDPDMDAQPEG